MRREIRRLFAASVAAKQSFLRDSLPELERVIERTIQALREGRTLFFFGNGGSAADAQHLAAEFVNRFKLPRAPLPALALTTDTSALTSIANDFGYDQVFSKQIEALGRSGDLAFAISTSGNSPSVLRGARACRKRGLTVVGMTGGNGGKLAGQCDHHLCVASTSETARVQECHILIGHVLCELVESALAGNA